MSEVKVPAIFNAMLKVMEGVANIPKNGEMSFGNTSYKYLKADDVQEALNPLLIKNKIVVGSRYTVDVGQRGNRDYVYVTLELTYYSTEDGSEYPTVEAVGESIAGDDKSINKALTQAIKNAHRATFQFASGEPEPDGETSNPAEPAKKAPATKKLEEARAKATKSQGEHQKTVMRDWVGKGVISKEDANALYGKVKSEMSELKGDDIFKEMINRLSKGEVG